MTENQKTNHLTRKISIIAFTGNYLPGYKAGGIIRNIVNAIDHLADKFDFKVVTRDRDLGDKEAYPNIELDKWLTVGNSQVYYLSETSNSYFKLKTLLNETPHDIILLNSFFDPLTIKVLLIRKLNVKGFKPVIVAPFGEFAWASLSQKYPKKYIFMILAKLIGLYDKITWRVSSEFEEADLIKVMNVPRKNIHITGDLPIKQLSSITPQEVSDNDNILRIVFLSRIAREKNLDYALKVLSYVKNDIIFDIYGPAENELYWQECQNLIVKLPKNISVNYLGTVSSFEVLQVFSKYDLFFFPTGGEAYGNVIAECLTVGTPVLISTATPWRNLLNDKLGWDLDLNNIDSFVEVIETLSLQTTRERYEKRQIVKSNIQLRLFDPIILESNISLFTNQLSNK